MRILFNLFLTLVLLQACSPHQSFDSAYFNAFPGLDEVVTAYYSKNSGKLTDYNDIIRFEKRKDGWYVTFAKREEFYKRYKEEMIWDATKQSYLFELSKAKPSQEGQIEEKFRAVANLNAFLWPVYGYEGASKDVIEFMGKADLKKLSAEELEGLARAYEDRSNYSYLGNYGHSYDKSASRAYDSTFDVSTLDLKLMAEAEENAWNAIDCYKNMVAWHPEHLTILGTIKMKYANNPVAHYLNFEMFQQRETAKKFMDAAEFTTDMTEMAKNYLRSCPPNAILITYGDNDTYPLLYVQQKLKFRKDVTIVNASLMAVGRCIYYYTKLLPESQRVKSSLGIDHYKLDVNNYIGVRGARGIDEYVSISKVFDYIRQLKTKSSYEPNSMPFRKLQLTEHISIEIKESYLIKDKIFLLDLIASNYPSRPICFAHSIRFTGVYGELKNYMEQQGLVSVLTDSAGSNNTYLSRLNQSIVEEKLLKEFVYPKTEVSDDEYQPVLSLISALHLDLMIEYKNEGDSIKAGEILAHLHEVMPIGKFKYGQTHLVLAKNCLELGDKSLGQDHLKAYVTELEEDLKEAKLPLEEKTALQRYYSRNDLKSIEKRIDYLISFTESSDFRGLANTFRKQLK